MHGLHLWIRPPCRWSLMVSWHGIEIPCGTVVFKSWRKSWLHALSHGLHLESMSPPPHTLDERLVAFFLRVPSLCTLIYSVKRNLDFLNIKHSSQYLLNSFNIYKIFHIKNFNFIYIYMKTVTFFNIVCHRVKISKFIYLSISSLSVKVFLLIWLFIYFSSSLFLVVVIVSQSRRYFDTIARSHEYSCNEWLLKIFLDGFRNTISTPEKRASSRVALVIRRS